MFRPSRSGFTLIEVLLVMSIIAVISAITIPTFVRSMRGNRLRVAARSIVMAGRYARSMAVLQQRDMAVRFKVGGSEFSVVAAGAVAAVRRAEEEAGEDGETPVVLPDIDHDAGESPPPAASAGVLVTRTLDKVVITRVEIRAEERVYEDGEAVAVYGRNGICVPYDVTVTDEEGESILVKVDMLGGAETER